MSFSYQYGSNPRIDYIRMLISDTQTVNHIFEDAEIEAAYQIQGAQFQSSMFYSGSAGRNLPSSPVSYLRVAALLLDAIASNKARLSSIQQLLDVKLNPAVAAQAMRDQAAAYRTTDDESGAFCVIEQVNDQFSFRARYWSEVQRQNGSGL